MLTSKVLSRTSRAVAGLLSSSQKQRLPVLSDQFHSLIHEYPNKNVASPVSLYHHSALNLSPFQRLGFSSSASPEPIEKEQGDTAENNGASTNAEPAKTNGDAGRSVFSQATKESGFNSESQPTMSHPVKRRRRVAKRTAFSDSDSEVESDRSRDDLVKLLAEKEELLNLKQKDMEKMQDKVLRTYAEMENVMERTKREAENSKKFGIQNFAKSLLDVADNLGRASSVVKGRFSKIDASNDTSGVSPHLKTLLEGVEMTEKQLAEVFKKYGVEKFEPINEPFDPHRHNAVFQVPDASKPPGTVAHVLKAGYVLHDRVIRPAEVGVTQEASNEG